MPYITDKDKLDIINCPDTLNTAGKLNYTFTKIALTYLKLKGENYQNYNDIIGALEGCKLELYRRKCSAYEDKKIKENGDVY